MGLKQAVDDALQRICAGSVSTHALREEGDDHLDAAYEPLNQFQSTLSVGRATC